MQRQDDNGRRSISTVLSIDMGSTWCKAAHVDRNGTILALGRVYTRGGPPFGHNRQELEQSWAALVEAVRRANALLRSRGYTCAPSAIALSCRKAPGIWLDADNDVLAPPRDAVLTAGRDQIDTCYSSTIWDGLGPFSYGYGVDLMGNTRWLWKNHPSLWARVWRVGTLHTWLMSRLTGHWVTSPAAGPSQFAWPHEVETLTGLPVEAYPEVIESYGMAGMLTNDALAQLDLPVTVPVVTGTHDGAAANLGAGAVRRTDACLTLGTNGVLRVVTAQPLPWQFGYPIVEGRWAMVRDVVGIAPHLDHIVAALDKGGFPVGPERHVQLTAEAARVLPGSEGLRVPVWSDDLFSEVRDAERKQLAADYPPGVVYRAALEGIALGFRGLIEVARAAGARPQRFVVTGGATANTLLLRIMSGIIGVPMHTSTDEAGVRGAAILAAVGAGWFSSVDKAVDAMVSEVSSTSAPEEELAFYADLVKSVQLPEGVAPGDHVRRTDVGE